jgi:hypothetical protein
MSNDRSPILHIASDQPDVISGKHVEPCSSNRQQRLLRLRNDRFPARSLPTHDFNSRLIGLSPTPEEDRESSPPSRNQENIAFPKPRLYGKHYHSTSSLGIFGEISNSIKNSSLGARTRDKRGPVPIFQDTPERALLDPSPYSSPLQNQTSSPSDSPLPFRNIQDSLQDMGLREVSGNVRKASASDSPGLGHVKPVRRRPIVPITRSSSEEYIQRIERELELAQDSVYSPNTNRSFKDKLKITQAENDRLRQELAETKANFEAEVQKAVQHKAAAEVVLRRKIKSLEDEGSQKDCIIRDLELKGDQTRLDQHTALRATIDRLESEKMHLEKSSEALSKRNEVLTHLLALSPTKTQQTFDLQTPSLLAKSNRPRSLLLPKAISSPTHTHPHRPQSLASSPSSARDFSPVRQSPSSPAPSDSCSRFPVRPDHIRTQSLQRAATTHSRSSTLASCVSMSPTNEHRLSSASSIDQYGRRASSRGPRRYLPGSTQLKPLLLPTLSGEFGTLSSTSPTTSPSKGLRRDFTDESVDPTTMFLSRSPVEYESDAENSYSEEYGDYARRAGARHMAYQSLEGVLDTGSSNEAYFDPAQSISIYNLGDTSIMVDETELAGALQSPLSTSTGDDADRTVLPVQTREEGTQTVEHETQSVVLGPMANPSLSSPMQEALAEVPEPLFSPKSRNLVVGKVCSRGRGVRVTPQHKSPPALGFSRKRRKISSSSIGVEDTAHSRGPPQDGQTMSANNSEMPASGAATPPVGSRPPSFSMLSPRVSRGPLELLQRKNFGVRPIAVLTIKTIYGTLSRCTTMLRDFRRDPLAMARRIIANAWRCNWAVLGKLSWWVLGLFLGPSAKSQSSSGIQWDRYDGEAIANRQCRRKSRRFSAEQQPLLSEQVEEQPNRRVRFDAGRSSKKADAKSAPTKPGWGKSVMLWAKFSTAIMLAVGGAVVKGPAEMLKDVDSRRASRTSRHVRSVSVSSKTSDLSESSAINIEMQATPPRPDFELRRRRIRRQSFCSPPPSARALLSAELDAGVFSSSPLVSSSPVRGSWRFGRGQSFDFDILDPQDVDAETLKASKTTRINITDIFDYSIAGSPVKLPNGDQEYDTESAGLGRFRSLASTPDSLK